MPQPPDREARRVKIRYAESGLLPYVEDRGRRPGRIIVTSVHRYATLLTDSLPTLPAGHAVAIYDQLAEIRPDTRTIRDVRAIVAGLVDALQISLVEAYALLDACERARCLIEDAATDDILDALALTGLTLT